MFNKWLCTLKHNFLLFVIKIGWIKNPAIFHFKKYTSKSVINTKKETLFMTQYYIYKIICLCDDWNGKFYIGKHYGTLDDNYAGSGKLIQEYFRKYGKVLDKTYVKEIIDYGDENSICDLEREYIRKGKQSELCLNLQCQSSKGHFGQKHSEESRNKIGEAHKGKKHSEETKKKMSESSKGQTPWNKGEKGCYSEESRKKMSESSKGKPKSEEARKKMSESRKGIKRSEATKRKISESLKRRWHTKKIQ